MISSSGRGVGRESFHLTFDGIGKFQSKFFCVVDINCEPIEKVESGCSRHYTVRMLAGLIHKVGFRATAAKPLRGGATAYKQSTELSDIDGTTQSSDDGETEAVPQSRDDRATQFARIVSVRWPTIKFLGVWETVASVIVPRPDRFYTFSLQELPHTRLNPACGCFVRQSRSMNAVGCFVCMAGTIHRSSCTTVLAQRTTVTRKISGIGSQVCTLTLVAAIRKPRAVSPNFLCYG